MTTGTIQGGKFTVEHHQPRVSRAILKNPNYEINSDARCSDVSIILGQYPLGGYKIYTYALEPPFPTFPTEGEVLDEPTDITVTWDAIPGALGYWIELSCADPVQGPSHYLAASVLSYKFTGLVYYPLALASWRVRMMSKITGGTYPSYSYFSERHFSTQS